MIKMISQFKTHITTKVHRYNIINSTIKRHFGNNMLRNTKLRLYNIASKKIIETRQ
jgi:hypothetical protein